MTFTEATLTCFRKYATFRGRASRSEYWWFVLFCILGGVAAEMVETVINGVTGTPGGPAILSAAFGLVTLLPQLSAGWRRMHDSGRSGLYLLYPLIVMIGLFTYMGIVGVVPGSGAADGLPGLILIVAMIVFLISPFLVLWWLTRPSQPGTNEYGPNPHEVSP